MATRRSRLQFRPNVGPKTSKGQSAPTSSRPERKPKESDSTVVPSVEPTTDVQPTSTGQTASEVSNVDGPATEVQSAPASETIKNQPTNEATILNNQSTGQESPEVEQQSVTEKTDSEKPEKAEVVKIDDVAPVVKPEVKPKGRSRFPKARPNLADSGRPKISRTPTSQVVTTVPGPTNVSALPVPPPEPVGTKETPTPTSPVKQSTTKNVELPKLSVEHEVNIAQSEKSGEEPVESRPVGVQRKLSDSTDKRVNAVLEKKVNVTTEKRKEHHSHRRLPSEYEPPNRQKLTMGDLIYWNPRKNVLKPKTKNKPTTNSPKTQPATAPVPASRKTEAVDAENDDGEDDSMPVPQVKIGPDGNIILNEESLVIDNQEKDKSQEMEIVEEDESRPCGGFYGNRIQSRRWNVMETKQFYRALATVGTDFTMLMKLFPDRSRKEIKNKFKKEEKYHRVLIDKAIDQRQKFDMAILEKFEQERRDYLEFVKSEELRVKQQKIDARLEKKKLREEKRKQRIMKENKLRRSHRKRRKTVFDDVPDDLEEMSTDRGIKVIDELHSKREEVVEILINMSYGCPSRQETVDSSDEGEKPFTEVLPFIPNSVKPVNRNVKEVLATDIQEDSTVDLEVCTTPMKESSSELSSSQDAIHCVEDMQEMPRPTPPVVLVQHLQHFSNSSEGVRPTSHEIQLQDSQPPDHSQAARPTPPVVQLQHPELSGNSAEAAARLQEEMADNKVQMILVPEESAGQTVIHVYIVPEGADSVTVDGRTVLLSPTHTPCSSQMMSPRYSAASPGDVRSRHSSSSSLLLPPSQHQTCSPAPCVSLDVSHSNNGKTKGTKNSEKQSFSGDLLQKTGVRLVNKIDDHSLSRHSHTGRTSFEFSSSSISALQQKALKIEKPVTPLSPQLCGSSRSRPCPQTQVEPIFQISSAQNVFTPLPPPSKIRKLSPRPEEVQSSSSSMAYVNPSESESSSCHELMKRKSPKRYPSTTVEIATLTNIVKQEGDPCILSDGSVSPQQEKVHPACSFKNSSQEQGPFIAGNGFGSVEMDGTGSSQEHHVSTVVMSEDCLTGNAESPAVDKLSFESVEHYSGIVCEPPPRTVVVDGSGDTADIVPYQSDVIVKDDSS
ncbi:inner centromere protein A-like [Gigantopelta aegis]|uniref:inner centromere protein A-like n=1 Tax=Gigantopelta aegis TaxID=1735272 RepID=UPI001B889814|nr:inner centromere protein A-like [Gigantopelta aegis]